MLANILNVKIMNFQKTLVLLFSVQMSTGLTADSMSRKHKVHNIVLYPDKHSWCTSTPIKQVISDADCKPAEIDNRVCLGACFSYSIPRTLPANNGDEANPYCDSCQPVKTLWVPVELTCNDGSNRTKHVQLIEECRCASCSRHWEYENDPLVVVNAVTEEQDVSTSRYLELMKLKHDDNAEDEDSNTTDESDTKILDAINATRVVYEKNVWIRGPHHSKVLLKKEMVNEPNIFNDDTQQHLGEDTADKIKL